MVVSHILQWTLDYPDPFGQSSRKTMPDKGKVRISEIMGHIRLPVAVNRAKRASCCEQGELRVELSGRQPCPTT